MGSSTRKLRLPASIPEGKPNTSLRVSDDVCDAVIAIRMHLIVWFSQNPNKRPAGFCSAMTANDVLRYALAVFCRDYGISLDEGGDVA